MHRACVKQPLTVHLLICIDVTAPVVNSDVSNHHEIAASTGPGVTFNINLMSGYVVTYVARGVVVTKPTFGSVEDIDYLLCTCINVSPVKRHHRGVIEKFEQLLESPRVTVRVVARHQITYFFARNYFRDFHGPPLPLQRVNDAGKQYPYPLELDPSAEG